MREHVEFVLMDRGENSRRDLRWVEPGLQAFGNLGEEQARRACGIWRLRRSVALRPVAATLADPGAHIARTEHGHANAKWLKLRRQPLRHADHRELARHVRAKAEPAIHPGHRGSVDDVATFAMGADMRKEGTDAMKDSDQIDVEHPSPIVERDIVDAAAGGDPGIVANHMNISECLVRRRGRPLDTDGIGNVTANAAYFRPNIMQAFDGGRQRVRLDIAQHHFQAGLRKGPAKRESDTTSPACHECCLAGQLPHDCPCHLWIITEAYRPYLHDCARTDSAFR